MEEKIEKKVANAVLQQAEEVKIGVETYYAAPPTIATLILASEAISRLPSRAFNKENVMGEVLANATECKPIGEVAAILILGAKAADEWQKSFEKQRKKFLWGLVRLNVRKAVYRKAKDVLAEKILHTLSPAELNALLGELMKRMQVADFFGLTTFLIEANMLKQTKVENEN